MMECQIKCGGHCCRGFFLPMSPIEIDFDLKRLALGKANKWKEIDKIGKIVIYKGFYNRGNRYDCRNLDLKTGLCKDYENRPTMCREYPYGKACEAKRCGK